jgi:two-component system, OmpR family, sensor kinase
MGQLVDDLLLLARFDAGRPLDLRPVDLASIAAEAVQQARFVAPGRPITLEAAEPVIVTADAGRLRQIIDNLIGNAIRHTPPESPVTVFVASEPGSGRLTVADRGPGMTHEQASRVFERFYRTDDARTRASGGAGLGLAIAASLTAAHGGELTVDTKPGRGAAFRLRLPLAESFQATATQSQGARLHNCPGRSADCAFGLDRLGRSRNWHTASAANQRRNIPWRAGGPVQQGHAALLRAGRPDPF